MASRNIPLLNQYRTILLAFSCLDCPASAVCLREVTYGACCIDDFTASSLGADFLVHYGHSCLVPVDETIIPCMYAFVNIDFDVSHVVKCIRSEFDPERKIALAGTIQFATAVQV